MDFEADRRTHHRVRLFVHQRASVCPFAYRVGALWELAMYCGLVGGRAMCTGAREATGVGEPMANPGVDSNRAVKRDTYTRIVYGERETIRRIVNICSNERWIAKRDGSLGG